MKIIHKIITYRIENESEIKKIITDEYYHKGWEAHNRSEVYKNSHGELQVDIFYRLIQSNQHSEISNIV